MSGEESAASTKAAPEDDGMTWWYRWLCKIAGILGGICKLSKLMRISGKAVATMLNACDECAVFTPIVFFYFATLSFILSLAP